MKLTIILESGDRKVMQVISFLNPLSSPCILFLYISFPVFIPVGGTNLSAGA